MSTTAWIVAGYLMVGLLLAAFWWHVNTSEDKVEEAGEELPVLRDHPAGGAIYYSATLMLCALVTVLWPAVVIRSIVNLMRGGS